MYKLYLCLQYLGKRVLAYFAMLGVALCVFVMMVCISILTGFVNKVEVAAKGLFGDIVVSSASLSGLGYYDEFIREIKRDVPAVQDASPFILSYGILRIPQTDYRCLVQVAGIRLPERAAVSDFEDGLFVQAGESKPTFAPPLSRVLARLREHMEACGEIALRQCAAVEGEGLSAPQHAAVSRLLKAIPIEMFPDLLRDAQPTDRFAGALRKLLAVAGGRRDDYLPALRELLAAAARQPDASGALFRQLVEAAAEAGDLPPERRALVERVCSSLRHQETALNVLAGAEEVEQKLGELRREMKAADDAGNDEEVLRLDARIQALSGRALFGPDRRAILGLGIPGFSFRTGDGEVVRTIGPGQQIVLSMIPFGRRLSPTDITPTTARFTVIDDCDTDVSSVDSEIVYVPFETLQQLNNMSAEYAAPIRPADANAADPNVLVAPARCSQIHVKVRPGLATNEKLPELAGQINEAWQRFEARHRGAATTEVKARTWRQMQSRIVSTIENQRTLMWLILSVISVVALVLIFVIMYVIVVQKTRDIGVLKAVGASSGGVAGIFLAYGAAIGVIGSLIGTVGGYFFVRNINPIHDWVGRAFGFVVWNRETFMFARIPNEVSFATTATIIVGAIASGIVGSLLPAVLAARKQPVEALRYE